MVRSGTSAPGSAHELLELCSSNETQPGNLDDDGQSRTGSPGVASSNSAQVPTRASSIPALPNHELDAVGETAGAPFIEYSGIPDPGPSDNEPGDAGRRDASVKDANINFKQGRGSKDPQKEWQKPDATKGWKIVTDTMTEYDTKMVSGWKDELGNLLIFAGLFSAVVTAFSVEAYTWLRQDPADRSVEILEKISSQLSSFSANAVFINSTVSAVSSSHFKAQTADVAINVLWFLSLTLALIASLFAILAQQWIRHYDDLPLVTGRQKAHMRQDRFDALNRWFVPQIIMGLAVLLQAALFLFFGGLIVLLWTVNSTVAIANTLIVAFFLVLFLIAALIPTIRADCPYKSPLAWAFNTIWYGVASALVLPSLRILIDWQSRGSFSRYLQYSTRRDWLVAFRRRLKCGSWIAIERDRFEAIETLGDHDIRVVGWTARVSLSADIDSLAPCLLESLQPREAVLRWIAHTSHTTHTNILSIIQEGGDIDFYDLENQLDHPMVFALVEHASHHAREAQVGMDFWEEPQSTAVTRVVQKLGFHPLEKPSPDQFSRGWSCWSNVNMWYNPVESIWSSNSAATMMQHLLDLYQRPERPGADEPITRCLKSIARSNWLQKLGHRLNLPETDQVSTNIPQINISSYKWYFGRAFELAAIVTIEDMVGAESKWHGPGAPQREDRRWDTIKVYFRLHSVYDVFGDGVAYDNRWVKALERLLECTSSSSPAQSFPVTRDEARNLVSLYVINRKVQGLNRQISATLGNLSHDGYPCRHLNDYLVERNLPSERQGVEMSGDASPRTLTPTIFMHSSMAVSPTT